MSKEYWEKIGNEKLSPGWLIVGSENFFFQYYEKLFEKKILPLMTKLENKKIMEIGCGKGKWSIFFAKQKAKVLATDFSKIMLERCQKNASQYKDLKNLKFKLLDITKEFSKENFDIIFVSTVLQHICNNQDFQKAVRNIAKSIKNNGKVIIIESAPPSFLSAIFQFLADKSKGISDCSYRSSNAYKREFAKNNIKLVEVHGMDLSFPLIYGPTVIKFIRKENWVDYFYHSKHNLTLLDRILFKLCSFADYFSDIPGLKNLTLHKILIFEKNKLKCT